jgi:uncharacterized protein (DUF2141 family)
VNRGVHLAAASFALIAAAPPTGTSVSVTVVGLRSAKGVVRACLTSQAKGFPECHEQAGDIARIAPANAPVAFEFANVPPGRYAIAVIHDENDNGKMDRALLMMPKEGYGFSRDAPVRMGSPPFAKAAFAVADSPIHLTIRMRYMF